jgi:hypothetical protein
VISPGGESKYSQSSKSKQNNNRRKGSPLDVISPGGESKYSHSSKSKSINEAKERQSRFMNSPNEGTQLPQLNQTLTSFK